VLRKIEKFDHASMMLVLGWRNKGLSGMMKLLTLSGTGRSWFVASAILTTLDFSGITFVPEQRVFLRSMLAALIGWALGTFLKRLIPRRRPPQRLEGFQCEGQLPTCSSFPSSHASASVAFFSALAMMHHPLAPIVGVWALLVSFSRFYLGVHFPSDLLAGTIVGVVCGTAILPALFKAIGVAF
jgi:undecaprenyl-diphosphatase